MSTEAIVTQVATVEPRHVWPATVDEVGEVIRTAPGRVLPRGGGSKPALSTVPSSGGDTDHPVTLLEMGGLSGITEYNPSEYTFTARAGTPLREIKVALAEHGQGLPFDPPLVDAGATLGGAVAAGLSGPGRVRYGGLRDFLLGITLVDGEGKTTRGGGRVVKNAAGLDVPRLLVGSLGRLGVLVEATFKVFPTPPATGTVRLQAKSLADAIGVMQQVANAQLDLEGLELEPGALAVYLRVGGLESVLAQRLEHVAGAFGGERLDESADDSYWRDAREMTWAPESHWLARVAIEPQRIAEVDAALAPLETVRRYSAGGHVLWLAWEPARGLSLLDSLLTRMGLSAVLVRGPAEKPLLGLRTGQSLLARIRPVLDPAGRFFPL